MLYSFVDAEEHGDIMTVKRDEKPSAKPVKADMNPTNPATFARFEEQLANEMADGEERVTYLQEQLAEAKSNTAAIVSVLHVVSDASSFREAIVAVLDAVRREFGWDYGSFWTLDRGEQVLRFAFDSGKASDAFREVTMTSTFAEGVGFNGRAWKQRDLFFVEDIGEMSDCARAPVAREMGVKSGVCFPILVQGEVVGTLDFFVMRSLQLSPARQDALRNVGRLVSGALDRIGRMERELRTASDFQAAMAKLSVGLTTATNEIARMNTVQSTASQNQATAIAELSATMSQLRHMAVQSMEKAQIVIDLSERTQSGAAEGRGVVDGTVRAMNEIREKVRQIAERISALSEQSQQIGEIIASVAEIAEQSRLLALNAAMEAARAGEHGRGFSVVANEIRSLASQSKESTIQVRKILGDIRRATDAASAAMEEGSEKVDAGVVLAKRAGERIEVLNRFIGEAVDAARLIALSARHQGTGIAEAADAIRVINNDSGVVIDNMQRSVSTVAALNATVADIATLVEQMGHHT